MKIFISYAREDEAYREELRKHLAGLRRQKVITEWHDRKLVAGQHWGREISAHLEAASVILLLVSPDFMDSDYCWEREMAHALAMEQRGDAVVIPVIIRSVDFQDAPFAHLQALPTDARPVSRWSDPDEAWVDVVRGIRKAIERFGTAGAAVTPPEVAPPAPSHGSFVPDAVVTPLRPSRQRQPGAGNTSRYGDVAVLAAQLYTSGDQASPLRHGTRQRGICCSPNRVATRAARARRS